MRTRPLKQLPMVPSRPQSAALQLSFRCLSKVVLPQKVPNPAGSAPWVRPNPDLDVPMYHHDQATLSVGTQQPLGAMRTNFTQVGPMDHILYHMLIQYNKDIIMYTDTDTLAYL